MEALLVQGKSTDHIWAMAHEDNGETLIGLRFDCGDSGTLYLTPRQAEEVISNLNLQLRELAVKDTVSEMSADQFYMYKWRDEHANEVIDLPIMLAFADAFNAHQTAEMLAERNKPYNSSVELVLEREAREHAEKALRELQERVRVAVDRIEGPGGALASLKSSEKKEKN